MSKVVSLIIAGLLQYDSAIESRTATHSNNNLTLSLISEIRDSVVIRDSVGSITLLFHGLLIH